jgi:hypothetical protein
MGWRNNRWRWNGYFRTDILGNLNRLIDLARLL